MMDQGDKMLFITASINSISHIGLYKAAECKKERLQFYKDNAERLGKVKESDLVNHSFYGEIKDLSRMKLAAKINSGKKVKSLERHSFAPELNKLHLVDGRIFSVPQMKTIEGALNKLTFDQLKSI